jgi:hypothetical protein
MRTKTTIAVCLIISGIAIVISCSETSSASDLTSSHIDSISTSLKYGGYESQAKWGEHIASFAGCNDCHTPKKMGPKGPEFDMSLMLSGHPSNLPSPPIDQKTAESKGLIVTQDLTAWVGPWGISYAANLTSDATGIGNWKEEQFLKVFREGKFKGLDGNRQILPPMPWEVYGNMTDDELKAIFAYLKSTKPIHNIVPNPQPPVTAVK